jgi:two-component system, cell cycle sensor histidine kinase and response regulator CckA
MAAKRPVAAEALRQHYESLIENSLVAVYLIADGKFVFVNGRLAEIFGYGREELIGKSALDLVAPESRELVAGRIAERLTGKVESAHYEFVGLTRSGERRRIETFGTRVLLGGTPAIQGTVIDVTERHEAVQALARSEERFRLLIESSLDVVTIIDAAGAIRYLSPSVERLLGYAPSELAGTSVFEIVAAAGREAAQQALLETLNRPGAGPPLTFTVRRRDGEVRTVEAIGNNRLADPEVGGIVITIRDVTDRERAEEEIRKSERQYRMLFASSPQPMFIFDREHHAFLDVNEAALVHYGYAREEFLAMRIEQLRPAEDVEIFLRSLAESTESLRFPGVWRHRKKNGELIEVEASHHDIEFAGRPARLVLVHDVTEKRRSEQSVHKLLQAVEQAENVVFMTDPEGTITYVNPAFQRLYGYSRDEAVGRNPRLLRSSRQDRAFYESFWKTLLRDEVVRSEIINRSKDGRLLTVETIVSPVHEPDGRRIGFIAVQHDVTRAKELERQFLQAQKMEAVGRLAGGVAHDFNNLLTAVIGYSDLLLAGTAEGPLRDGLVEIRKAGERAASLTRQLLAFSRRQVLVPKVLDLNAVVADLEKMLRRLIGEDIVLLPELDPELAAIRADPGQIEQVLVNLIVNSRDAMPRGGTITIQTRNAVFDDHFLHSHEGAVAGAHVLLSVRDTGSGMDSETRSHIFEPFFTTKEKGKGTGLGLATVYGIVKQSGGYVWVESEPGRGAEFTVAFPAVADRAETGAARKPATSGLRGTESVLLVEDDEAVRRLARVALERSGYRVVEARDGREAFETAREPKNSFDLIITDLVMPRIGGRELAAKLAEAGIRTRILFTSGYPEGDLPDGAGADGIFFIEKPFTPDALLRKIRKALDQALAKNDSESSIGQK